MDQNWKLFLIQSFTSLSQSSLALVQWMEEVALGEMEPEDIYMTRHASANSSLVLRRSQYSIVYCSSLKGCADILPHPDLTQNKFIRCFLGGCADKKFREFSKSDDVL